MSNSLGDIVFYSAIRAVQEQLGSRDHCARLEQSTRWQLPVRADVSDLINRCDSFYFGTASADGRPYIQHRGGRPGFLALEGDSVLTFVEEVGNRQYISFGNLSENGNAFLFITDYAMRRRFKFWGTAKVVTSAALSPGNRRHHRVRFEIEAWDANCPKNIPLKYSQQDVARLISQYESKIEELQEALAFFKSQPRKDENQNYSGDCGR